jgi:hypothetical protein
MGSQVTHSIAKCCARQAGRSKTQSRGSVTPNPVGTFFSAGGAQPGTHRPARFWQGLGVGVCATANVGREAGGARRRARIAHAVFLITPAALATARAGCFGPGAGPAPGAGGGAGGSLLLPVKRAAAAARFFYGGGVGATAMGP